MLSFLLLVKVIMVNLDNYPHFNNEIRHFIYIAILSFSLPDELGK